MSPRTSTSLALLGLLLPCLALASVIRPGEPGPYTGVAVGARLYTRPDPEAGGGITGRIAEPGSAVMGVFALPQHDWRQVYIGQLMPERGFRFEGLPVGRYDLLIVFANALYEGLRLHTGDCTLTESDRTDIRARMEASSGFFDQKVIHRCEGTTGREGRARLILQEVRTRPMDTREGLVAEIQFRSIKLALLEQVGPGWSLEHTREIARQEVGPNDHRLALKAWYAPELGGIRVLDQIRELGELRLQGRPGR